jgi:hypothetical protein
MICPEKCCKSTLFVQVVDILQPNYPVLILLQWSFRPIFTPINILIMFIFVTKNKEILRYVFFQLNIYRPYLLNRKNT